MKKYELHMREAQTPCKIGTKVHIQTQQSQNGERAKNKEKIVKSGNRKHTLSTREY
jgi:hypothetical protein